MTANTAPALLDLAPLGAGHFARIEDKVAALMRTRETVVTMQGEALLPLEACIRSAVRPGSTALNVVTGPYGETFGGWLRSCGAEVITVSAPFSGAVSAGQIAEALRAHPGIDFVCLVHAEAATGNTNPVAEIGAVVREHGALLMLDAVASVGAEPLLTDEWGVDLCVIGGQKAMAGPAGVSVASVSARAWERIAANEHAPRRSYLSLLDWKERWIDGGRTALPHAPAQLEMLALEQAVDRIGTEGLDAVMARHRAAAAAVRAGVRALGGGLEPYVVRDEDAAPVATTLRATGGTDAREIVAAALAADASVPVQGAAGALAPEMIRVNHYGTAADRDVVLASLAALGTGLRAVGATVAGADEVTAAAGKAWDAAAAQ
ncbi:MULTISPECIES: pyridoxal-phosphate-dependent aminotransferase family protein [Streptomyces]|uniref:Alanine--glyoxylate aminotransferase family protein n=1 Tax=Streptomyces morookaense TaxID=1970 RepID=A0A7Y7B0N5_STRMO|nr:MULTISPECIES: aminotransferase class V-fold PLP-dependent enzyme [Streptomyces]MCC2274985.1 aminotransferase class V-fold PLP-dependent enzyme [Streptomyces sp. ET3-23]NVK76752.1 alanine--glyoxylate aminotransferase family protein [Streptomyces morookaense]GHF26705.1 aspartate aminotransferase [Streptomyces morookaense]